MGYAQAYINGVGTSLTTKFRKVQKAPSLYDGIDSIESGASELAGKFKCW